MLCNKSEIGGQVSEKYVVIDKAVIGKVVIDKSIEGGRRLPGV
ncbi:hypothetical protein [Alteromonas sp. RW2A1]|nr:hypothetical protein [Alteromonas sp. RW2A1]